MWKKTIMVYFKVPSQHFSEDKRGTEGNHEKTLGGKPVSRPRIKPTIPQI
jgi:hypothetical protein